MYLTKDTTVDMEVVVATAKKVESGEWSMARGRAEVQRHATRQQARRSRARDATDLEIDATLRDLGY